MHKTEKGEMSVGIYRTHDALKNFKIKASLKKAAPSFSVLEEDPTNVTGGEAYEPNPLMIWKQDNVEECIFGWQEKVFSSAEIEYYGDENNWQTFLENNYHQMILEKKRKGEKLGSVLFTYVEADITSDKFKHEKILFSEASGYLAEQSLGLRQRFFSSNNGDKIPSSRMNETSHWFHRSDTRTQVFKDPGQTMYIMGALPSDNDEPDEIMLCAIHADSNGTLYVTPDFNKHCSFYSIQTSRRELFQYNIDHASNQISKHEAKREKMLMRKLYSRSSELIRTTIGTDFDMVPDNLLHIHIYGEVVSAKDFECDNLYIHYFLDLPEGWSSPDSRIDGATQTCKIKVENKDEVAYFCYPFHVQLLYQTDHAISKDNMLKCPHIYVEAVSVSFWGHQQTEGYGYGSLPITPGSHLISLNTWRPITNSCTSKLRRFFIGESPELEDLTFTGVPTVFQGQHLSKFGIQTQSSGSVSLRLHVVHHSQAFIQADRENRGNVFDHLMTSSTQSSIAAILAAFQRARQRMMAAREMLEDS